MYDKTCSPVYSTIPTTTSIELLSQELFRPQVDCEYSDESAVDVVYTCARRSLLKLNQHHVSHLGWESITVVYCRPCGYSLIRADFQRNLPR